MKSVNRSVDVGVFQMCPWERLAGLAEGAGCGGSCRAGTGHVTLLLQQLWGLPWLRRNEEHRPARGWPAGGILLSLALKPAAVQWCRALTSVTAAGEGAWCVAAHILSCGCPFGLFSTKGQKPNSSENACCSARHAPVPASEIVHQTAAKGLVDCWGDGCWAGA